VAGGVIAARWSRHRRPRSWSRTTRPGSWDSPMAT